MDVNNEIIINNIYGGLLIDGDRVDEVLNHLYCGSSNVIQLIILNIYLFFVSFILNF